ncbi:MAG: reverse transcriptase domain-containing protein [Patescibacteria group bacterium]
MKKTNNLLKKVATQNNLRLSWDSIKHRDKSKGIDNQTIEDFENDLKNQLNFIRKDLLNNKYKFLALRGYPLKKGSKTRAIKIPAVRDRVVQKAIELVIFDYIKVRYNIDNPVSFAYIKKKRVKDAVDRIVLYKKHGYEWVYNADIRKFFDTIDVSNLLNNYVFPCLPDKSINKLIEGALINEIGNKNDLILIGEYDNFVTKEGGIPQGGILSPLFANIYLYPLDEIMIKHNYKMVRYADDFIIMCKTKEEAVKMHKVAKEIIENKLRLKLHPLSISKPKDNNKYCTIERSDFEFLGIKFRGSKIYPVPNAFKKIIKDIKIVNRNGLFKTLNYLKTRVDNWGATYYYTNYEKSHYSVLDDSLQSVIKKVLKKYGLKPTNGDVTKDTLVKIGMPTFTESLTNYKNINKKGETKKDPRDNALKSKSIRIASSYIRSTRNGC